MFAYDTLASKALDPIVLSEKLGINFTGMRLVQCVNSVLLFKEGRPVHVRKLDGLDIKCPKVTRL